MIRIIGEKLELLLQQMIITGRIKQTEKAQIQRNRKHLKHDNSTKRDVSNKIEGNSSQKGNDKRDEQYVVKTTLDR